MRGPKVHDASRRGSRAAPSDQLAVEGIGRRVVSMPRLEACDAQRADYRDFALPCGRIIGIDRFGESAPANPLFELFGFTAANVAKQVRELLDAPHEAGA
jgi:transketolase